MTTTAFRRAAAVITATVCAGTLVTAGVAIAAGPDPTINGCVGKIAGVLRVIDPAAGQKCLPNETPISWNKVGPAGPPGPAGPAGSGGPFGVATNAAAAGRGGECTLGEIILSAGPVANGTPANGQVLPINQNTPLFALLGTTYGGDGVATFALPDLRAAAPDRTTYSICTEGTFPARQ